MILAGFLDEPSMMHAASRLREAALGTIETYTPSEPHSGERRTSPLPAVILVAFVLSAAGAFLMQSYATTWSYPIDIGGRPDWSWPAYIPTTFELGALAAVAAGFFGFLIANRLPHLYDPIDESDAFRQASRDGFFLAVRPRDDTGRRRARELLDTLAPASLEELGG